MNQNMLRYIIRMNDSRGTWYRKATSRGHGGWVNEKDAATRYTAAQALEYLSAAPFIGLAVGDALAVIRVA